MKTTVLPCGSVVALVEIKSVRVEKHFWSDKFYVELEFKNRTTRSAVERVSHERAAVERQELIVAIQLAYDEVDPFDYGYQEGRTNGHMEGRASGLEDGRAQGYQQGYSEGRSEGFDQGHNCGYELGLSKGGDLGSEDERARILGQINNMRETLVSEQRWGELVEPYRRRSLLHFVGNAPWSDTAMLAKVGELVLPAIERSGPVEAWIIDDTGFPNKGRHSVGGHPAILRAARQAG